MAIAQLARRPPLQDEAEVPWWALGALDLEGELKQVKARAEKGQLNTDDDSMILAWNHLKAMAKKLAGEGTALEFARAEPDLARRVARYSPRAFMELADIRDDDDQPVVLAGFHLRALQYMRKAPLSVVLLPAFHGKSWMANIAVPLLDWTINPEATQLRIYASHDHVVLWIRKLMDEVENNEALHFLWPDVRRPEPGDKCADIWSTQGFAIGGKVKSVDWSFKGLTVGTGRIGLRADRIILDDLVTEVNASSRTVQEKYARALRSTAMTTRRYRPTWTWKEGGGKTPEVAFGTLCLAGTIFDKRDVNARTYREWKELIEKGDKVRKVLRIAVYPRRGSRQREEVIWPRQRPYSWVKEQEDALGQRAFRQRFLNAPFDADEIVFREELVNLAFRDDLHFGTPLPHTRTMIGYDPAIGTRGPRRKFPAAVVMQFPEEGPTHVIEWGRWSISAPQQVRKLADWANRYDCPVVVESNNLQRSYGEWMAEVDPNVRVINHFTGNIKHSRDDGIESFQPLFENESIVFHCGGATLNLINDFKNEWLDWPQGEYSDLMMAAWICRYQYRKLKFAERFKNQTGRAPGYVSNRGGYYTVDLRPYR